MESGTARFHLRYGSLVLNLHCRCLAEKIRSQRVASAGWMMRAATFRFMALVGPQTLDIIALAEVFSLLF